MKKISLNHDWLFVKGTLTMMELFIESGESVQQIDLPHDAMICQERTKDTANGHQTGFYPGGEYTYLKQWEIPKSWENQTIELEFEGIADTCRIYLNGDLITVHYNPYTGIFVDVTPYIHFGETNEIKVEVCSVEQSGRWYSGAGIYRCVSAWIGGEIHIPVQGSHITTAISNTGTATVDMAIPICNRGRSNKNVMVECSVHNQEGAVVSREYAPVTVFGESHQKHHQSLTVDHPLLWSDETPNLYTCQVDIKEGDEILDSISCLIGIRSLQLNAKQGLLINGKTTKLRGTCIHHDNGIIGAATYKDAEFRRCLLLKQAGFNAIRSAHHPISKAMLEACDQLGMLVLDELTDMWTRTKNQHDYANYFPEYWRQDVQDMVEKDFNHPSVIIYSTGNEIPEAGTPRGAEWNRKINDEIKRLDPTRYTTNGINGLIAGADKMGEMICLASGMTPEELAAIYQTDDGAKAGADAANGMAQIMVGPLADAIATSPILEGLIGEFAAANDIAGYNYLTALHEEEHVRHPNRLVLGTETFPADIVNLWDVAKRNAHVLGDFTWTGFDYLGEAGCGVFHYDGGQNFAAHWPDRLAGIGDIDILGDRKPISFLRQAVYGIGRTPAIGVLRMDKADLVAGKTPWMWKDNIASWTWPGYEGKKASVDIYANADEVELLLNGTSLGRQSTEESFAATFEVPYQPGILEAVSYCSGSVAGKTMLKTAGKATKLKIETDKTELMADGESLAFVKIHLADESGNINRWQSKEVTIKIEGAAGLLGFGSAHPSCEGSYQSDTWSTYDGVVMAVIRAAKAPGKAKITVAADGCEDEIIEFAVSCCGTE